MPSPTSFRKTPSWRDTRNSRSGGRAANSVVAARRGHVAGDLLEVPKHREPAPQLTIKQGITRAGS